MKQPIILDRIEEEYLVRAFESGADVRKLRQLFLWAQGEVQNLLPHGLLVCILFDESDAVQHVECLPGMAPDPEVVKRLCDPASGLAVRMAQYCRDNRLMPCAVEAGGRDMRHPLSLMHADVARHQMCNALVHGTERLTGGATFFVFFLLPEPLSERHAFFADLLLPCLHMAFLRVLANGNGESYLAANGGGQPLTEREIGILRWVMKGKSNYEIGMILELSPLTVKNHMQKIFRKLKVHNRAQAVARSHALQLLDRSAE